MANGSPRRMEVSCIPGMEVMSRLGMSRVKSSSNHDLDEELDLFSDLFSVSYARQACPVYEDCNGSCSGTPLRLQPSRSRFVDICVTLGKN